jgi:D-xylose transport system permease protein
MLDHKSTSGASASPASKVVPRKNILSAVDWRSYAMVIVVVIIAIIFNVLTDGIFLSPRNISQLARQAAVLIVVASGVSLLIIQGEIDLSIGSAVYLTGLAAATAQTQWHYSAPAAVLVALAVGLLAGVFQGFWVSRFNVPSFVITLAGLLGFRGLGYVWSNAATLAPMEDAYVAISETFIPPIPSAIIVIAILVILLGLALRRWRSERSLLGKGEGRLGKIFAPFLIALGAAAVLQYGALGFRGIPMAIVVALAIALLLGFVLQNTKFGRQMYVIGGSREAAFFSGINIRNNIFFTFALMGCIYAVGGILSTARLNAIAPSMGQFLELDAIAAAVIGGVSLAGGIGTVHGAIIGALLLTTVDNGMSLMNVSSFLQLVVKAILLGAAVLFDVATRPGGRKLF